MKDIQNIEDIKIIVDNFYESVRKDEILGFIFDEIAGVNWEEHLPKMYIFWENVLFATGNYKGNPMLPHFKLSRKTKMTEVQFNRWKELFIKTVDENFSGPNANRIKIGAGSIADLMLFKINQVNPQ